MKTQRRRLFRNEDYFGSGERDIFQVIRHEVASLWNTDIFKYCLNHYRLSDSLSGTLSLDISIIEEFGERPEDLDEDIKNLVSELSSLTGKQLKFVLWLAEKDAVRTLYQGTEENMSCYEASDVILSDLGLDGILFAYEKPPQPTIISETTMKQSLSEAVKKAAANPDRASLHPEVLLFSRIPESAVPVVLNATGPEAYACGQDRRRQRRERERRRNR